MRLVDISLDDLLESEHDLVIWCNGYEERATFFPSYMEDKTVGDSLVLGFRDDAEPSEKNTEYFEHRWPSGMKNVGATDSVAVVSAVEESDMSKSPRILVDYSSMPRDWYAAIVDFVLSREASTVLDLVYSTAEHVDPIKPARVSGYHAVFGCDSVSSADAHSTLVVGLGFDGVASLHAVDEYEPDHILAYAASPGSQPDYFRRAVISNQLFIDQYLDGDLDRVMRLPIWSVEAAVRGIRESTMAGSGGGQIILAPFGPKPFVLASIVLANSRPDVSCVNSIKRWQTRSSAPATGQLVLTRISNT